VPFGVSRRIIPSATGMSLTLAWIIALRMNLVAWLSSPTVCWALIATTVSLPLFLEIRLSRLVFVENTVSRENALRAVARVPASLTPAADC